MSEQQPHVGTPEYLDRAGGSPIAPRRSTEGSASGARRGRGRGRRRAWWIAGGAVVLLGAGAGAWAALSFFHQGAQPAEALPASTLAYLSVDLDPSGGQKIDAFRTLNKFPAFKHDVGVGSVGDLRHKLGDQLVPAGCHGLTFDHDIAPWLGDRAAVALVSLPASRPATVVVVQVTDEARARDGISALNDCASGSGHPAGFVVQHGWAVLASDQQVADQVVTAAGKASLADDATYQRWTKAVGDPGVVNAYAAPGAGRYLASSAGPFLGGEGLGRLGGMGGVGGFVSSGSSGVSLTRTSRASSAYSSTLTVSGPAARGPFARTLSSFGGGAATFRFTGDGLELAVAADTGTGSSGSATTTGGALVQRLPDDTAIAVGASLSRGWIDHQLSTLSGLYGGLSKQQALRQLSRQTGLALPGDLDTLVGRGFSLSVGKGFDPESAQNSTSGAGLPIAATVQGDPAAIGRVLDKLRAKLGDVAALGSDSAGDLAVIGPTAAYRTQVLHGGHLGDDPTFRSVVPDAGDAGAVAFVDVDTLEPALARAGSGDRASLANVTPLHALGWSSWKTGGVTRFSFRLTTN